MHKTLIMKRVLIVIIAFVSAISLFAQHKFDPEKFKAELHQYIEVQQANRTGICKAFADL